MTSLVHRMLLVILPVLGLLISFPAQSLPADSLIIHSVTLKGNKITYPRIITRELTFKVGDTISVRDLETRIFRSRDNVFNTGLFNHVTIDQDIISDTSNQVAISVNVVERWYIWPIPYIEFPNKNMNAWFETTDFSRLTYGLNINFYNLRGRNETLTAILHFGYNQSYGLTYKTPYLDKRQTWGFGFGGDAGLSKQVQVYTSNDKPVYLETPGELLQQRYSGFAEVFIRNGIHLYHNFRVAYDHYFFADTLGTVAGYLPDEGRPEEPILELGFVSLSYKVKFDKRDMRYYPLKGMYYDLELVKQGFSDGPVNTVSVKSSARVYVPVAKRWHVAAGFTGMISFPEEQYFFMARGLGFGRDFVRGYERYLIVGQHFATLKSNIKFSVLPRKVYNLDFIRTPKFAVLPVGIYANLFADYGYVYSSDFVRTSDNPLVNSSLFGYGAGIDFVTYYDVVVSLNFAMNLKGEPGLFLHFIAPI